MTSRDSSVDIVSLFIFSIIFSFLRTLWITRILDERYIPVRNYWSPGRPKDVCHSIPMAFPTDLIWPSRRRPDLTCWGRPEMTSTRRPILTFKDVAGRLIRNVPRTFSGRPLWGLQSMSEGRCGVISWMSQNFFLLFFRNCFDWSNLSKSDTTLRVYCKPSWTSNMERFLQNLLMTFSH